MVTATELFAGCVRRVFTPRPRLLIDQWADLHRNVVHKEAARPGRWVSANFAYMIRPMRLAVHPLVRQASFKTATQVGKTETLHTIMLYLLAGGWSGREGGSMMMMYPSEDLAVEVSTSRFQPNLMNCEPVRERLGPSPHDRKNLKIDLDDWVVRYAGSNSENNKIAYSVRVLCLDELDKFRPGWSSAWDRNKAFADYRRLVFSSPTLERTGISEQYDAGDRESFFVPCPHCGVYQRLRFGSPGRPGSLCWEGGTRATEDEALNTAYYLCENKSCGGRIHDWHKPAMNRAGVWVPEGQEIERCRERDEKAESDPYGCEPYPPSHVSFQISSLHSPLGGATFGEMAKAFVAGRGPTQKFVNSWMGEEWITADDRVEIAELRRLCIPVADGGYRLGECPMGVLGLILSCDIQKDRIYLIVRGWGEGGIDSWLVDRVVLPRREGLDLVELDQWLGVAPGQRGCTRRYGVLGLPKKLPIAAMGIDSGHFTVEVYNCVRRLRHAGLFAVATKGLGTNKSVMSAPWRVTQQDRWPDSAGPKFAGRPMVPGCPLFEPNTTAWKTRLVGRMKGRPEAEDAGQLAAGQVPGWYLPANENGILEEYLDYVTAEERREDRGTERAPREMNYVWATRKGRDNNHDFDAEYVGLALAEHCNVRQLRAGTDQKGRS